MIRRWYKIDNAGAVDRCRQLLYPKILFEDTIEFENSMQHQMMRVKDIIQRKNIADPNSKAMRSKIHGQVGR